MIIPIHLHNSKKNTFYLVWTVYSLIKVDIQEKKLLTAENLHNLHFKPDNVVTLRRQMPNKIWKFAVHTI